MRILVVGASGYLAQFLLQYLHPLYECYYTFNKEHPDGLPGTGVHLDLRDEATYGEALKPAPSIVINAAAMGALGQCEDDEALAVSINSPERFFQALANLEHPPLLVQFSTDQVYDGDAAPYADAAPSQPKNAYGRSKQRLEQRLQQMTGLRSVVLRSSNILGPPAPYSGRGKFLQWLQGAVADKLAHGEEGKPVTLWVDEHRSFIWVHDICHVVGAICAQESGGSGPLIPSTGTSIMNMGGPERLSRVDVGVRLCEAAGFPADVITPVEHFGGDFAGVDGIPKDLTMDSRTLMAGAGCRGTPIADGLAQYFRVNGI